MNILGIDPGVSTGIVLYNTLSGIVDSVTIVRENPIPCIRAKLPSSSYIVIESVPQLGNRNQIVRFENIYNEIYNLSENGSLPLKLGIIVLSPGEWKPFVSIQKWQYDVKGTRHEKDAYCMIIYALKFRIRT